MKRCISLGSTSFELPSHMFCLSQNEIDNILRENLDLSKKIVASGLHPADGIISVILASGEVLLFDGDNYHIPRGKYVPVESGAAVFLPNESGRWPGPGKGFSVKSEWIISKSKSALTEPELFVCNKSMGTLQI